MTRKAPKRAACLRASALSISIALTIPHLAYAQQTDPSPEETQSADVEPTEEAQDAARISTPQMEEMERAIIVTGTRASMQGAIARKKSAGTQSDSIVAEDIDSFPDKNIGEALQRVTGVQLTRDFGEGSQVSIRGVEPDLNRVELNGASVLGNDGEGGRGADFRELASELVKSVDVIKGSTADLTEGGVGGTVNIETRRPTS